MVGVYDADRSRAQAVGDEFGVRVWSSSAELVDEIQAAVVAVPTVAHADLGVSLLERGIHVLVEKPIAASLAEADALVAAAGDRVLAVGHVEFHNPAVQALLAGVSELRFAEFERLSPFTPRSLDVDVVLDLMIHDLQILHALDPSPVVEVRATGIEVLSDRVDMANARLVLESGCVANVTASRVSSERVRKVRTFLSSRYYSLDYQQQQIKGYRLRQDGTSRAIEVDDLPVERAEPLLRELEAFARACRGEPSVLVDGAAGRRALDTAEAVLEAIGGNRVE